MFWTHKKILLRSPLSGTQVRIEDIPDFVFSEKIVGDGAAVNPSEEGVVRAPCAGRIKVAFSAGHAVEMTTDEGVDILIHVGIDTVEMNGAGFEALAGQGDAVEQGQPLFRFDLEAIRAAGKCPISPVVITNMSCVKKLEVLPGPYTAGKTPILEVFL